MIKEYFKGKKKLSFYLIIILVLLVGITLGSALLSSTLKIIGNSKINKNSWVIYFDDIDIAEDSALVETSNDNARIAKNGVADPTKQNIEFTASLKNPGDFYEFTVWTVNDGTIDAEVESLEKSTLTEEQLKYLEFDVTYDDGTPIEVCDFLYHKGSDKGPNKRLVKAVVKYKEGLNVEDYPSEGVTLNLFFKINYSQNVICTTPHDEVEKNKLTIRPNGGVYEGRKAQTRKYLEENEEYLLKRPTRDLYNFDGWKVINPETGGTYELTPSEDKYLFTMGSEDVTIEAKWKEGDYVARIMDHYYTKVELAFDAVDGNNPSTGRPWENNTVWLIRDTDEVAYNNARSNFTFNLDGHTLTGKVVNPSTGKLTLVGGKIVGSSEVEESEKQRRIDEGKDPVPFINGISGEAVLNYGNLTLGKDDGNVEVENSISLVGEQYGLFNVSNSKLNFYDGYVQGREALSGIISQLNNGDVRVATSHMVFVDSVVESNKEYQKVYLVPSPNRAVAKTTTVVDAYYYTLQDAIDTVIDTKNKNTSLTDSDYVISAIRTFEAAYDIEVQRKDSNGNQVETTIENSRVFFDLNGYSIQTGENIINKGYFKVYNSKNNQNILKIAKSITNENYLEIDNVNIPISTDVDGIVNKGHLKLNDVIINSHNGYCIKNIENGTLDFNENVVLKSINRDDSSRSDQYALYNSGTKATINNGTIYGLHNTGTITLDGENTKYLVNLSYVQNGIYYYIRAINNSGTINMNNGIIETSVDTGMIYNTGTFTLNDGTINSEYLAVENGGTVNVKGSEISSSRTAIKGGTINVDGGNVRTSSTDAITNSTIYVKSGEVIAEDGVAVGNYSSLNIQGGKVTGTTYGVYGDYSSLNISSGLLSAPIAANTSSATVTGGKVVGSEHAIVGSTTNIGGGEVTSPQNTIITSNLTMSGGKVECSNEVGITINGTGNITGGEIYGGTYGVLSKDTLTLGSDDGTISSESPRLEGELLGLYIEGSTTNFYDGILKGQGDGYSGNITGLPLGGVIGEGIEDRQELGVYNTDFVSNFAGWLRIGDTPYNTLNAASTAALENEETTIIVTRDADIKFSQKVLDENNKKKIILDLNGHKITTTQNITNYSNLTIIDSSEGAYDDTAPGPGTIKILKNDGLVNYNKLIINDGRYEGITNQIIYNKTSELDNDDKVIRGTIINGGTFSTTTSVVTNGIYEDGTNKPGYLVINGINVETSYDTINNPQGTVVINGTKNKNDNTYTTVINAANNCVNNEGSTIINGGKINTGTRVVTGDSGYIQVNEIKNINLDDDNQVASTDITSVNEHALYTYWGTIDVNGGNITSQKSTAVLGHHPINIHGGTITGIRGVKNEMWCTWSMCAYEPITVTGGTMIGTQYEGTYLTGGYGYFKGGLFIGQTDGIYNSGTSILGTKGENLSITSPEARGINGYGFNNDGYMNFYDGILKGKKKDGINNSSHDGMIQNIEDATMVKRDYEYINNVYYETEYLVTQGDWLEIEGKDTYNTVDKACSAASDGDTIKVIADTHIAFEQRCQGNKNLTFDENGHSVSFTQPITFYSNIKFIDSIGNGLLNNQRTNMIISNGISEVKSGTYRAEGGDPSTPFINNGTTTVTGGNFQSVYSPALTNNGTMTFNDTEEKVLLSSENSFGMRNTGTLTFKNGNIKTYGGLDNAGTFTMENGTIEGTNTYSLDASGGMTTINGGEIINNQGLSAYFHCSGDLTMNGGRIISTTDNALYASGGGTSCDSTLLYINDGELKGKTNGIAIPGGSTALEVNGGHIVGQDNNGININNIDTQINSGVIEGGVYGLYTNHDREVTHTQLGNNDRDVAIDSPVLKGGLYGLYINNGILNFYDGILKGQNEGFFGQITNIADRTQLYYDDDEVIDEEIYQVVYLLTEKIIVKNIDKPSGELDYTEYTNLQDAFNAASNGDNLVLVDNAPIYYEVTNNKNVTLDMNGYTISTNKKITNNADLVIKNTSDKVSTIKTSAAMSLITSTDSLELDNITLRNNSSSYYVVQASGNVILKNSIINSIYGINSSQSLNITNSEITCSRTAINSLGSITINGGIYSGADYSIYSSTNKNININNAVLNGIYYNEGSNTAHIEDSTVNGEFQTRISNTTVLNSTLNRYVTNTGTLLVDTSHIYDSISNSGNMTLLKSEVKGSAWNNINNTGTMTIKDSTTDLTSYYYYSYYVFNGITNSGTLDIDNSIINQDIRETNSYTVNAINNTGTLTVKNNTQVNTGTNSQSGGYLRGIYTSGTGIAHITDSLINVTSGATNYGVYLDSDTSKIVLETGTINTINSSITYGAYINRGTFELGKKLVAEDTDRTVSKENPRIYSAGTSRGIGVKKFTANFNFYDGVIYGSKYAKPDTTTNVESLYEVTTYVQDDTGFEYAWLEFMGDDYQVSDTVASITRGLDTIQYPTVQAAIEACAPGEEIILLKSISEPIEVPSDKIIALNLNNRSLTSKIINNGILQVYNGSIQNFDDIAVVNAGTFIMGQDDGTVSSTSVRVVSESIAVKQNRDNTTFIMYDGYIEGNPSISGEITEIADFSRIYTVKDNQSEKKYLQSLDENSIINGETALFITIDSLSGYYDGVKGQKVISQFYGDVVKIKNPIKGGCTFLGWDTTGDVTLIPIEEDTEDYRNGYRYKFTVGLTDITLKANWKISDAAVAKIGEEYYESVADALMEAKENDTVELIKNVEEDVSNDKNITLNLGGKKLTGTFINNGILRIVNGIIENPDGVGLWNKKTLIVGENDGTISSDSIKIIGTNIGIQQDGGLKFYDGRIEGKVALNGDVDQVPKGYFLYIEHDDNKDCQIEYLIGNPQNAVAIIKSGSGEEETVQYYFSLQDAIDTATISGKEIFIVKDFTASYTVNVKQNANIVINLNGCNVQLGNTFTNNGTLKLYDTIEADDTHQIVEKGSIATAKTIDNKGTMNIEDISISQNKNEITIKNFEGATLSINGTKVEAKDNYAIQNMGNINLLGDYILKSNTTSLYNSGTPLVLKNGTVYGIETTKNLTIEDGVTINTLSTNNSLVILSDTLTFKMTGGTINGNSTVNGIYNSAPISATISGGTINAANGIYCGVGNTTYTVNGGTITGDSSGIDLEADYCNLVMNNGTVTGTNYGVYSYGKFNDITLNDGLIKSTSGIGIRDNRYKDETHANDFTCTINGGKVIGATHGMEVRNSEVTLNGGELTTTSTNVDHYGFYADYWNIINLNDGALINVKNASGLRSEGVVNMEAGARIHTEARNGYGIRGYYLSANINGGTIEAIGDSSYGILSADNYFCNITINDGTIKSGNIGIGLINTYNYGGYDRVLTINGGNISGEQYGIYQPGYYTTTIGSNDKELSTTIPIISGGLYGIYRTDGVISFYNGRLRGITNGYSGDIDSVRKGKEVVRVEETSEESVDVKTYSTDIASEIPTPEAAKKGHGYAKITYIGEDTAGCENGHEWPFDYQGFEEVFNVTCPGKYKLEVWGAQGGSSDDTVVGGYGGYSKGEINLTTGEKLYINVGEQPNSTTGGYNGGGTSGTLYNARGGGGATHIALESGLLATLENKKSSVIIVAGAGGGSDHYQSGSIGGHAGGYIGGNGNKFREWDSFQIARGGTQNYGGSGGHGACYGTDGTFGNGGSQCNSHGGGGGAGFYGGGGGGYNNDVVGSGAGGSGYIGNTRLTNKVMYGYEAKPSLDKWIVNYLANKENFLQVDDELFNSINDATAYIEEYLNGEGTIVLFKSASIQEDVTFKAGTNITFELQGNKLTTTKRFINLGNLSIVDNSSSKTGIIENTKETVIQNDGTLTLDGVTIKGDTNYSTIYASQGTGQIKIKDSTIDSQDNGISLYSAQNLIIENSTINSVGNAIYSEASGIQIDFNSGTINSQGQGIRMYSVHNVTFNMLTGTINSKGDGIYVHGYYNTFNITTADITSQNNCAIESTSYNSYQNRFNISDGNYTGGDYGLVTHSSHLVMTGGTVTCKSTRDDRYALYHDYYSSSDLKNVTLNSVNASGMYINDNATLENVEINVGNNSGAGIYHYGGEVTIKGNTRINSMGNSSYGIYNLGATLTINNIDINSSNIGIGLLSSGNVNINSGSISSAKKGIYVNHVDTIINIGNLDSELSTLVPSIKGEEYGIYKESGTVNFYNGALIGKSYGYYGDLGNLRPRMKVAEERIEDVTLNTLTYSTTNISETPTSKYAKNGNGHARITYIGDTNDNCLNGSITNFNYTGSETTFTAPCDGKFLLEVWGAQGAYASEARHGGPGGYSKGEILLSENEVLYINVGGQGSNLSTGEGGYNGGGSSASYGGPGGGGGATHIATSSGLLKTLEDNKDKVIIVAGGGGGFATYGCSTAIGGSGGGYMGSPDELGGTQYKGGISSGQPNGSFGQGAYAYDTTQSTPGAGGGWYGGGTRTNTCLAGGGSGYIGNTRLTNAAMYGYNVSVLGGEYIKNYLVEKENFLQVDDRFFNDFNDAVNYIKEYKNKVGTIYLLKDASVNDSAQFDSGTDITLDLQGFKLITTERLHNKGTLTITGSTPTKRGTIECISDVTIENEGSLTVNDVDIKSSDPSGSSTIYAKSGTGNIDINNAKLDATYYGLNIDSSQTININGTSIKSVNDGIYIGRNYVILNMTDSTIDSSDIGILLSNAHYAKVVIDDCNVESNNQAFYVTGSGMDISLDNDTFTSRTSSCVEFPSSGNAGNKVNINEGTYNGHAYGLILRSGSFEMTGGTINNENTRTDYYAVYHDTYSTVRFTGTEINAVGTSGIYSNNPLYLNATDVNVTSENANGIYNYGDALYIEDGTSINAIGTGSNGIYNVYGTVYYNDGSIYADVSGIHNYSSGSVYIYGGSIGSKSYGIYQNDGTVTIGNKENDNSTEEPYIEGSFYGFTKVGGTSNFYSGKLKGYTHPYNGTFNNIREGYEVFEEPEDASLNQLRYKSVSTGSHSTTAIRESAKEGNGYAKLTYHNTEYVKSKYTDNIPLLKAQYDYDFKYGSQTFEAPTTGTYKVELWGAQGNTPKNHRSLGGKGAYTSGTIDLTKGEKLYVYVGEYREDREQSFNAGTAGGNGNDTTNGGSVNGYGGGGATDIRLEKGRWNLPTSLASRIMVAAGGGGGSDYAYPASGGYGGALVGGSGDTGIYPNRVNYNTPPTGGTQTSGGLASVTRGATGTVGTFGIGGQGQSNWGSGGGGGYYGGGGGGYSDYTVDSGAGGSSYISGYTGSIAVTSRTSLLPRKNSDGLVCQNNTNDELCSEHYSGKVFSNTTMIAGNETMPDYRTNSTMVGNTGEGHARISLVLSNNKDHIVTFVNEQGTNTSVEYSNSDTIGSLPLAHTDRTDIVFEGWYLEPSYITKIDENYVVSKDMNVYAKFLYKKAANNGVVPTSFTEDDIIVNNTVSYNFNYTGSEQTFTVLESGYYKLETWGAQGGKAVWPGDVEYRGGYGAYTTGQIYLSAGDVLYINVGEQGSDDCKTSCSGGYNGGGRASGRTSDESIYNVSAGSGGGATHIALKSGTLSSLEEDKSSIIMVSGGGGGSLIHRYNNAENHWQGYGGSAGGFESSAGNIPNPGRSIAPTVATQTSAGIGYTQTREVGRGSFGKGQDGDLVVNVEGDGAGAGGGYYGGGSSIYTSTSGGSGYINSFKLTNAYMACYGCTTSNDVSTKTISINDTSLNAVKDNAKEGNGYARITKIKSVTNNLVTTYGYKGYEETFVVPEDGYYKLETWGAQGGNSTNKYATNIGGYGSYSTGNIYLHKDDVLYINVGGKADDVDDIFGTLGGYNGGGNGGNAMMSNAYADREYRAGAGGGGATHIALKSGLLSSFDTNENNNVDSNELSDLIIVSGGGGGATSHWNQGMNGGSAGGYKGLDGINCLTNPSNDHCSSFAGISSGGTQTSGYSFGKGQAGLETAENGDWNQSGRGGGGGGLYGGFASQAQTRGASAGGGGSGYINTSMLSSAYMACYGCEESSATSTKTKAVNDVSDEALKDNAKEGNGYVKITKLSSTGNDLTTTYNYTGSEQIFTAPRDGYYKLETWGAQGGDYDTTYIGGYGGYSTGVVELNQGDKLYINVGGQGNINCNSTTCPGGYNGGGSGAGSSGIISTSGGGATHIALESGLLNTFEDKRSKLLIVSGGGGGTSYEHGYTGIGGSGGGAFGVDGTYTDPEWPSGHGGTQDAGGAGGPRISGQNVERGRAGSFGLGGIGVNYSGGGGGGYYGGGASNQSGAGGGSGYIGNSLLQNKHMSCFDCIQSDALDTKTISVTSFSEEAIADFAKKGNGVAKVTYISDEDAVNVEFKTDYGTLPYPSRAYVVGDSIGQLPTPALSDDTMIFKGWYLEPTYNTKVNENYIVQSNVRLFAKFMYVTDTCMIDDNEEIVFDYTGNEQSYTIACGGNYTIEVWGAQGGGSNGGYGGYSRADIAFDKGEKIYINVGGQGAKYDGGYNGGGLGGQGADQWSYGGGGATHVALASGLLSTLKDKQDKLLIVAGAGGGSGGSNNNAYGGSAGGYIGSTGFDTYTNNFSGYNGTGATQSNGGHSVNCGTNNTVSNGSFGKGGDFCNSGYGGAGGGAGYYGGGGSNRGHGGAGGGTGYVGNPRLTNMSMYGYNIEEKNTEYSSKVAYLIVAQEFVINRNKPEGLNKYKNLQEAFDDASSGDTLELMTDATLTYDVRLDDVSITLDLKGFNLLTNKQITNNSTLNIVNTNTSKKSKLYTTLSSQLINNLSSASLTIDNVELKGISIIKNNNGSTLNLNNCSLDATTTAIENLGSATITDSTLLGTTYGYYDNSQGTSTITNSTITSVNTAIYKNSSGTVNIVDTNINGLINNNNASSMLGIGILNKPSISINGKISNNGKLNISNANITYVAGSVYGAENLINNTGIMTLTENNINYTSSFTGNYERRAVYNSGTLTSTSNKYYMEALSGNYLYYFGILNEKILTSVNDDIEINRCRRAHGIYAQNNNHETNITGANIKINDVNEEDFGIVSINTSVVISSATIESYNNRSSKGIAINTNGDVTANNLNIDLHDNTDSYGLYVYDGSLVVQTGIINSKGTNAYGMYMLEGEYIQGTYDGSGTESADVSLNNPYLKAEGTTRGIGVSMGNGNMSYYDGYIYGTTRAFAQDDIVNNTEKNYQVLIEESNRKATLEYTKG